MKLKDVMVRLKKLIPMVLVGVIALSMLAFVGCGQEEEKEFLMTYELAKQMNKEKFGVEVASVSSSDLAEYKWMEDGFIRMSDPDDKLDKLEYYNIVHNLEIKKSDGKTYNIYGMFQVPLWFNPEWIKNPEGRKFPVAIECHGYNTNSNGYISSDWANAWGSQGYIAYAFDFVGGSPGARKDYSRGVRSGYGNDWGQNSNEWDTMSVLTEVEDLDLVIDEIKKLDFINEDYIALMGQSQGGVVCAIEAANREKARAAKGLENDIKGLVLIYPAFSFIQDMHLQYPTLEDMEAAVDGDGRIFIMGANIGTKYITDTYNMGTYDPNLGKITMYDLIKGYSNSVLIVTGTADTTVDPSWSYNAINQLTSPYGDNQSTLVLVSNAVHAFDMMGTTPLKQKHVCRRALVDYLQLNDLVPSAEE